MMEGEGKGGGSVDAAFRAGAGYIQCTLSNVQLVLERVPHSTQDVLVAANRTYKHELPYGKRTYVHMIQIEVVAFWLRIIAINNHSCLIWLLGCRRACFEFVRREDWALYRCDVNAAVVGLGI